jgi:hypothetical protein
MKCKTLLTFTLIISAALGVEAQAKLSPKFQPLANSRVQNNDIYKFSITTIDLAKFYEEHASLTVYTAHPAFNAIILEMSVDEVLELSKDSNITFIDFHARPKEEAFLNVPNFHLNRIRKAQSRLVDLYGLYPLISIKERTINHEDLDLLRRGVDLGLAYPETSDHATDMATIILGAGNTDRENTGIMPAASWSSSDFTNLFPDETGKLETASIKVQNHSYGVGIENYYGNEASAYDLQANLYPELIHVFSSGNFGGQAPISGIYEGLNSANLSGTFKQAKNVLVVNAYDSTLTVDNRNSIGPAYDGRVKPELVAYGFGGTSDAAALTTGVVSMLQSTYSQAYDENISSSLVKSLLIASSDPIKEEIMSFRSGYGALNAKKALFVLQNENFKEVVIRPGERIQLEIGQFAHAKNLTVAMSWIDDHAPVNAEKSLMQDIDGLLIHNGSQWKPWVLSSYPNTDSLEKAPRRLEDHLNNVEFFTFDNPSENPFQLDIDGHLLTRSVQVSIAYYVTYHDFFESDYPFENEILERKRQYQFLWENSFEGMGSLYQSFDNIEWALVDNNVILSEPYYLTLPDTSALVNFRMDIQKHSFEMGSVILSSKPSIGLAYDCDEEKGIIWDRDELATGYSLLEVKDRYNEVTDITEDSLFSIPEDIFYAVRPSFDFGEGLSSTAINIKFQKVGCYLNFFEAQRFENEYVDVRLDISTVHDIEEIIITRVHNRDSIVWKRVIPGFETSLILKDSSLLEGRNTYYANIKLESGSEITSSPSFVYNEKVDQAILFPNPTIQGDDYLNILTSGSGQLIQIIDRSGKVIIEKELFERVDFVIIKDLRQGLYFYRLWEGDEAINSGKFIKY